MYKTFKLVKILLYNCVLKWPQYITGFSCANHNKINTILKIQNKTTEISLLPVTLHFRLIKLFKSVRYRVCSYSKSDVKQNEQLHWFINIDKLVIGNHYLQYKEKIYSHTAKTQCKNRYGSSVLGERTIRVTVGYTEIFWNGGLVSQTSLYSKISTIEHFKV